MSSKFKHIKIFILSKLAEKIVGLIRFRNLAGFFKSALSVGGLYTGLALVFSFTAFLNPLEQAPTAGVPLLADLDVRGGHLLQHALTGVIAGVFSGNLTGALYVGAFAVLIDFDHLWAFLQFPVIARPDHTISFAVVSSLVLGMAFAVRRKFNAPLALLTAAGVVSHLALDSTRLHSEIPIFAPLVFDDVALGGEMYFSIFLIVAIVLSFLSGLILKRHGAKIFTPKI